MTTEQNEKKMKFWFYNNKIGLEAIKDLPLANKGDISTLINKRCKYTGLALPFVYISGENPIIIDYRKPDVCPICINHPDPEIRRCVDCISVFDLIK